MKWWKVFMRWVLVSGMSYTQHTGGDKLFRGEHFHSIDVKGRMIVPAKFREELSNQFIITKGLDQCLFVFTMKEWEIIEQKVENLPMTDKEVRKFLRLFIGSACDVERDDQGRALIPQNLREFAGISKDNKEIVLVGVGKRIEIWSRELYEPYIESALDDDVAAKMALLGI